MMEQEEELSSSVDDFLNKLKKIHYEPYYYQEENILNSPTLPPLVPHYAEALFKEFKAKELQYAEILHIIRNQIQGRDLDTVKYYDLSKLDEITSGFSKENLISKSVFGNLYRGNIRQDAGNQQVLVKTWNFYRYLHIRNDYPLYPSILCAEMKLLMGKEMKSHVNLVKLTGYGLQKKLAVVFESNADRLLSDELKSDKFDWNDRMKVALQLAKLLQWLHDNRIILGAVDTSLVLIDEDYHVALFEFGLHGRILNHSSGVSTGVLKLQYSRFAPDPVVKDDSGLWTPKSDVYAYGSLLLELIMKKYDGDKNGLNQAARWTFCENAGSVVHEDFGVDVATGLEVTELVMKCLEPNPNDRVDMRDVVRFLEQLTPIKKAKKQRTY